MTNMNQRLEMFCDGVFAIAITLLILEIKVPPLESVHSVADVWHDVIRLWPSFFALGFSFLIIFISWVGHHNVMTDIDKTSPQFQFANGFFLLTVIIIPWPTSFMAEYLNTPYAQPAIVIYSLNCILHNVGWNVLLRYTLRPVSLAKDAASLATLKQSRKGNRMGFIIYVVIAIVAWWLPYPALLLNVLIWGYWLYLSVTAGKKAYTKR
jgi:uncharacterized membrane protein